MKLTARKFLIAVGLLIVPGSWSPGFADDTPSADRRTVHELIELLSDRNFREREMAMEALKDRNDAVPMLRRVSKTGSAEAARRAKAILQVIVPRHMDHYLDYGRTGRVDIFVEWLGTCEENLDRDRLWQCVLDIGWEVLRRAQP